MAFVHGKNTRVLVDKYNMSSYLNNTDLSWEVDAPETTVYGQDDRTYITGLRGGTMSFAGFYDASTNAVDDAIPSQLGQAAVVNVSYAPNGFTVGNVMYSVQSRHTNYTISSPVDGVVPINLDVQGTDRLSRAISLHDLTARSSDGSGSAVDSGSTATTSGGIGYLHITSFSSGISTSATVKIQDSPTSTSWADLISFTAATTRTAERMTVTGSVDRYVRANWAISSTSAGSLTFVVGFQRL